MIVFVEQPNGPDPNHKPVIIYCSDTAEVTKDSIMLGQFVWAGRTQKYLVKFTDWVIDLADLNQILEEFERLNGGR